ncbi:MAG: Spy/CpxP family protein refolding chaperone [Blastocatellia bacterium]
MKKLRLISFCFVVSVLIGASPLVSAQRPQRNPRMGGGVIYGPKARPGQYPQRRGGARNPGPNQQRQNNLMQRIIRELGLSPEQERRMQQIRQAHGDDVIAAGRRIRQARRALDQAMMSEQYDEKEVNRRIDELAQAQYEQVRLKQHIRAEIRRVFTPEQVTRFLQIQREIQQEQREQRNMELERQDGSGQRPPGAAASADPMDILMAPPPQNQSGSSPDR